MQGNKKGNMLVASLDDDLLTLYDKVFGMISDGASFEVKIYPKELSEIDYIDAVFLCNKRGPCSINVFAMRSNGVGIASNMASMPSLVGSILTSSALGGSYTEIFTGSREAMSNRIAEITNDIGQDAWDVGDEELDLKKFMSRIINAAKSIGTRECPSDSRTAFNLFLRSLMATAFVAHSPRTSSMLADEIRGVLHGYRLPPMILTSRISREGKNDMITVFLELNGEEMGVAAEVRENNETHILEGLDAISSFIKFLIKKEGKLRTYCTVLYGYPGMSQY